MKANKINTKIHLCPTCKYEFATCNGNPKFGDGYGNDNVYQCDKFFAVIKMTEKDYHKAIDLLNEFAKG